MPTALGSSLKRPIQCVLKGNFASIGCVLRFSLPAGGPVRSTASVQVAGGRTGAPPPEPPFATPPIGASPPDVLPPVLVVPAPPLVAACPAAPATVAALEPAAAPPALAPLTAAPPAAAAPTLLLPSPHAASTRLETIPKATTRRDMYRKGLQAQQTSRCRMPIAPSPTNLRDFQEFRDGWPHTSQLRSRVS